MNNASIVDIHMMQNKTKDFYGELLSNGILNKHLRHPQFFFLDDEADKKWDPPACFFPSYSHLFL